MLNKFSEKFYFYWSWIMVHSNVNQTSTIVYLVICVILFSKGRLAGQTCSFMATL